MWQLLIMHGMASHHVSYLARHAMLHGSKYIHLACMLHVPNTSLHATTLRYLRQLLYLKLSSVGVDVLWATLDPHGIAKKTEIHKAKVIFSGLKK